MDGKQIRAITAAGISYLNEDGSEAFIDFSVCYSNYIRKNTSPEHIEQMKKWNPQSSWDEENIKRYIERRIAWKQVGDRNVLGQPWSDGPYIEFHTEPPIRFDFETTDEYAKARYAMEQFGWRTFDRS